jgi:osmotically-inducible protein OsmY
MIRSDNDIQTDVVKQPKVSPNEVSSWIERALGWADAIDADRIRVHADDGQVTLSGTVWSLFERREAGYGARQARGVTHVTNNLEVQRFSSPDSPRRPSRPAGRALPSGEQPGGAS